MPSVKLYLVVDNLIDGASARLKENLEKTKTLQNTITMKLSLLNDEEISVANSFT